MSWPVFAKAAEIANYLKTNLTPARAEKIDRIGSIVGEQLGIKYEFTALMETFLYKAAQSPTYGGNILALSIDDTHVYVGGVTTNAVRKYLKSDMSLVAESPTYGGNIFALAIDDTHVYAGGATTQAVYRYDNLYEVVGYRREGVI